MYTAFDVARFIIWYSKKKNYSISNLKLQKILYFIQADYIANKSKKCFSDIIEAWDLGPVVASIYDIYKIYGSAEIPIDGCEGIIKEIKLPDQIRIGEMVDKCSKYSASKLVSITHGQEPWKGAYKRYANNEITPQAIRSYFAKA